MKVMPSGTRRFNLSTRTTRNVCLLPSALCLLTLLLAQPPSCRAQGGGARAPKDEEPLAAALRLARGLDSESDRENVLVRLVLAHREGGRLEEAVRVARAMDNGEAKAIMLSHLANRFAEAGQLERAAELLSETLLVARRDADEELGTNLLQDLVAGEQSFNTDSFPSRTETRKGALARLFEAGRAEAVEGVFSQVRKAALDRDEGDSVTLLAYLARFQAATDASKAPGLLSEALAVARRLEDGSDRVSGLCRVARAYADLGDMQAAESLLDEARQVAATLDDGGEPELRGVASDYAAVGLKAKARAVYQQAGAEWENPYAAVEAAEESGRPEALREGLTQALAKAYALEWDGNTAEELTRLAGLYGPRAPELLSDVLWAARSLRDDYSRAKALAAIGDKYDEAGRKLDAADAWRQAYESARVVKLRKSDYKPGSWSRTDRSKIPLLCALGSRLMRAGEYTRAADIARDVRAVHAQALSLAGENDMAILDADAALAALADELSRAGQKEAALALLVGAVGPEEKLGKGAEPYARAGTLALLGGAYAKAGEKERAAAYLRRVLQLAEERKEIREEEKLQLVISVGASYAEAGMQPDARARRSLRHIASGFEADKD